MMLVAPLIQIPLIITVVVGLVLVVASHFELYR